METRAASLKRNLEEVEQDEDKKEARDKFETVMKRARKAVVGTSKVAPKGEEEHPRDSLSDEEKAEITMVFNLFDLDSDGHLNFQELEAVLKNLGFRPTTLEVSYILKEADQDDNGTIELDEFMDFMARLEIAEEKEKEETEQAERLEEEKAKARSEAAKKRKKAPVAAKKKKPKTPKAKGKQKEESEEESEEEEEEATTKATKKKKTASKKGTKVSAREAKRQARRDRRKKLTKGDSKLSLLRTGKKITLTRGLSISDFYTNYAGLHNEIVAPRDAHSNPIGREFDLGREGAFTRFSILVGIFTRPPSKLCKETFQEKAGAALTAKGFAYRVVTDVDEFCKRVDAYENDVVWVTSAQKSKQTDADAARVAASVKKFHESGGGVFVLADNDPFTKTANAILSKLNETCVLTGNTPGKNTLKLGNARKKGQFGRHLITSGLESLYEGITICYPRHTKNLNVLATSSDNRPCILYADYNTGLPYTSGRLVVDTGYTKLYNHFDEAGCGRYIRNVSVYLLGLDHRMAIGATLQGRIDPKLAKKAQKAS